MVYWSADCEFCDLIAPDLVRVESRLGETKTKLLLLAYGSADANRKLVREHGLTSPVLLVEGSSALKQLEIRVFHYCGTPSAYLLDEHGRVTQPLANGAEEVVALVEEAATGKAAKGRFRKLPLTASGIEREGLEPGSPAPAFSLPDIHGQLISLEQFRGGQVLLVFSDPQCVPCNDLAPRLVEFDRQHGDKPLAVVMVGRGHQEQNQRTVEEHGIRFPVVLQQRWRLSKEYGIFATPVAFLIGPDGVIARDVAKGSDAIMQLAREGLASEEALEEEKEASVWDNYSTTSPAS